MKIVHIITSMNKGGAETTLFKILEYAKSIKSEDKHIIITFAKFNYFESKIEKLNYEFYKINFVNKYLFFIYFIKLYKILREIRPDLVQCWMYHASFLGGIASKLIGIKKIIWNIRHSNFKFTKTKLSTIIIIKLCSYLSKIIPNKIIYCSNSSYEFHSSIGYETRKKLLIYNGYDKRNFNNNIKNNDLKKSQVTFGFIGRYSPQKNIEMYLNALSIFINKHELKKNNIAVLMYGKNIDSNNIKLTQIIKQNNLSSFVELKGYVEDVTVALKEINFLALSSSYGESFPNILAEAMLSGVPCLSTDVGEAKNILSKYGKISQVNDVHTFSKSIEEYYMLYKNKRDYSNLSAACTKHIIDNYSIDKMYYKYEKLWSEENE